jgi:hypothetical protein
MFIALALIAGSGDWMSPINLKPISGNWSVIPDMNPVQD